MTTVNEIMALDIEDFFNMLNAYSMVIRIVSGSCISPLIRISLWWIIIFLHQRKL